MIVGQPDKLLFFLFEPFKLKLKRIYICLVAVNRNLVCMTGEIMCPLIPERESK